MSKDTFSGRSIIMAYFIFFVAVFGMFELFSFLGLSFLEKQLVSPNYLAQKHAEILKTDSTVNDNTFIQFKNARAVDARQIIHPYLGFVRANGREINDFGFIDTNKENPIRKKGADTLIVGLFGGSVAENFYFWEGGQIAKELQSMAGNNKKKVIIVSTALGGYKQPQQLLALTYLLSLGAEFDIIINIDGFNEVNGGMGNAAQDIYAYYPQNWYSRIGPLLDPRFVQDVGELTLRQKKRTTFLRIIDSTPLKYSYSVNLIWVIYDRLTQSNIASLRKKILTHNSGRQKKDRSTLFGPKNVLEDTVLYADIARQWAESSAQMNKIARQNGSMYFHFLQPNQYLDRKKLSQDELVNAFDTNKKNSLRNNVIQGYPYLIAEGGRLKRDGVAFFDETNIFNNSNETLYIDTCCHFNKAGSDILLKEIINAIRRAYSL